MISTKEAARYFGIVTGLLSIKGENSFKLRAYESAVQSLSKHNETLDIFLNRVQSKEVKGFGEQLTAHLNELMTLGEIPLLQDLKKEIPEGLQELLKVKGLSGKKIKLLHDSLGIIHIDALKAACIDGSIKEVKGYAEKSAASLLDAILFYEEHRGMIRHSEHEEILNKLLKNTKTALTPSGASARKSETYTSVELTLPLSEKNKYLSEISALQKNELKGVILEEKINQLVFKLSSYDTQIKIEFLNDENLKREAFLRTATKDHLNFCNKLHKHNTNLQETTLEEFSNELEYYSQRNLPVFPLEMRDGLQDARFLEYLEKKYPEYLNPGFDLASKLVSNQDIKGVIHAHSTYSDGINTLEELTIAAINNGYSYLGISDHSKSAAYAGGLTVDQIKRQHEEIEKLNEKFAPFIILKGIESDILKNGELDYPDTVLQSFDFIIASIHNRFSQNKTDMTKRIVHALENPYTSILGHSSGRLLIERAAYEFDLEAVLEAAANKNVCIEFNSNPKRLDISWKNLQTLRDMGIRTCISPDAHAISQFEFIKTGVQFTRKAGFFPEDILNTLDVQEFITALKKK